MRFHLQDLSPEGCKSLDTQPPIFVVKRGDKLAVYVNQCPHLGIRLEFMPDQFLDAEAIHIQCSLHGALFDINDGYCLYGPCQHQSLKAVPFHQEGDWLDIHWPPPTES